jgi:mono/diheme cytochrome c family protein
MKYILSLVITMICSSIHAGNGYVYNNGYVQPVVVHNKIIEFDARYFQGLNHYFSVGEKIQKEKQEEVKSEVDFYKGQIDMLLKILANQQKGVGGTEIKPEEKPATPSSPATPNNGDQVTDVDKKVYNIFKNKCVHCHGDTKQDGGLTLIKNDILQLVDIYDRVEIYDRILGTDLQSRGKARMPKGSNPLSDEEVEVLRLWMVQESDFNRNK